MKHYYAVIETGADSSVSVYFPSFPGTTSQADGPAEMYRQAQDALATVVEAMEAGGDALPPSFENGDGGAAEALGAGPTMLVPVEIAGRALRVNVSLNEGLLGRIDDVARRTGTSRSALLARGARLVIAAESV
jgi:predicted RNase H-like HicB family nuclease